MMVFFLLIYLQATVKEISEKLSGSLLFVNGDSIGSFETLEAYQKQKKHGNDAPAILQGSLFLLCVSTRKNHFRKWENLVHKYFSLP